MEVLERSTTPQGVKIQLEYWPKYGGYQIGAYPTAKNTSRYRWTQQGQIFRLTLKTDAPKADFEALGSGEKTLEEMDSQYWNGEIDRYYMGLRDTDPEQGGIYT